MYIEKNRTLFKEEENVLKIKIGTYIWGDVLFKGRIAGWVVKIKVDRSDTKRFTITSFDNQKMKKMETNEISEYNVLGIKGNYGYDLYDLKGKFRTVSNKEIMKHLLSKKYVKVGG